MSSHLRDNKQNEKQLITGIICSIFIFINFFLFMTLLCFHTSLLHLIYDATVNVKRKTVLSIHQEKDTYSTLKTI